MKTDVTGKTWDQLISILREFREREFIFENRGGRIILTINPILVTAQDLMSMDKEG